MGNRAGFAPGEAREDWAILRALSDALGKKLPFDSLAQLRDRLYQDYPHFAEIDDISSSGEVSRMNADESISALAKRAGGSIRKAALKSPVDDFYLTNPIARSSAVMAECSARAKGTHVEAAE